MFYVKSGRIIRVWKPLLSRYVLKTLRGKLERENLKMTISVRGGLGCFM